MYETIMAENLFINIDKADYKNLVGIDSTNADYHKIAFINDGSGIITRGQLYVNSPYWIKCVDKNSLPTEDNREENTIYMVFD